MQRRPAVSVIVCFLNEERFLAEAVESVLGQSFADWELILVDDGSTDGSSAIARGLAATSPDRIACIDHADHRNLGLSASRNAGLSHARGRYVAFLDADDAWLPRKLEEQTAILDRYPDVGMVVGASQYWRSWTGDAGSTDQIVPIGTDRDTIHAPPDLMLHLYPLGEGACPPPSDLLLRREVVDAVDGFEPSFRGSLMLYEDQAFLSKIYRTCPVYVASTCWDRYRQRPEGIVTMTVAEGKYWQVRLHFLKWLRDDLARTGSAVPEVRSALERALRRTRLHVAIAATRRTARRVLPGSVYARLRRLRHLVARND